ncbi:MAG: hypothetical protein VW870_01520 [Rhodobiaceae bacterium]
MSNQQFTTPPDSLKETEFMAQFGGIYEHSPWVAATIWSEGLGAGDGHLSQFAARMRVIGDTAGFGEK